MECSLFIIKPLPQRHPFIKSSPPCLPQSVASILNSVPLPRCLFRHSAYDGQDAFFESIQGAVEKDNDQLVENFNETSGVRRYSISKISVDRIHFLKFLHRRERLITVSEISNWLRFNSAVVFSPVKLKVEARKQMQMHRCFQIVVRDVYTSGDGTGFMFTEMSVGEYRFPDTPVRSFFSSIRSI